MEHYGDLVTLKIVQVLFTRKHYMRINSLTYNSTTLIYSTPLPYQKITLGLFLFLLFMNNF